MVGGDERVVAAVLSVRMGVSHGTVSAVSVAIAVETCSCSAINVECIRAEEPPTLSPGLSVGTLSRSREAIEPDPHI